MKTPHFTSRTVLIALLVFTGCITTSRFDQYAYVQTTAVKVDALNLMAEATDSFGRHEQEVKQVTTTLDKIFEYEKNRKNNRITLQLWNKLRDTSGHLYGGFVLRWKNEGKLGRAFIRESAKQVDSAFDQIAQLESKKIKPSAATQ